MNDHRVTDQEIWAADADWRRLSRLGREIYETRLRTELEPAFDNQFVALHVDSGDYTVARSSGDAIRALAKRHDDFHFYVRKIGREPENSLSARILSSDLVSGAIKGVLGT
jgi:hypothetical protein